MGLSRCARKGSVTVVLHEQCCRRMLQLGLPGGAGCPRGRGRCFRAVRCESVAGTRCRYFNFLQGALQAGSAGYSGTVPTVRCFPQLSGARTPDGCERPARGDRAHRTRQDGSTTDLIGSRCRRLFESEPRGLATSHTSLRYRLHGATLSGDGGDPSGEVPLPRCGGCQHASCTVLLP